LLGTSCVSLVTPEQSAIQPQGSVVSPVGITVADQRTNTSGGFRKDRYYGRCRLSYGIPSPVLDPKMSVATRLAQQLAAGFKQRGSTVVLEGSESGTANKTLTVRLNDVWIDFANPLTGNESILYFDATAEVRDRSGKVIATAARKREANFRYDVNDSFFNQAVKTLQPEFTTLINQPSIRAALAR
jgi:hypothetical protein